MADNTKPVVVIIRRKKKGGHEGHHGGAWKVAYADFVTAMMSFFLLLWLLNVTTDVQRKGIADYFAPASVSKSDSGAGGFLGGQTITVDGAQISAGSPPSVQSVTVPTVGKGEEGDEDTKGKSNGGPTADDGAGSSAATAAQGKASGATLSKEDQAMAMAMKGEEAAFKQAETLLKQAIANSPELRAYSNQIAIDSTPEGLRIQIIDRDKFSMFPSGGSIPYERGRDLLMLIGKVIARLPNKISVTGHTDSTPFPPGSGRDNWTLSTERANVSREYLVQAGVSQSRIQRVSGLADRDPYIPNNPKDPRNRRISIVLLRQATPEAVEAAKAAAPATPLK